MGRWIGYYNQERLDAGIMYLSPEEVFQGRKEQRLAERREKLHSASINRQRYWEAQTADL
jgi:hypothetical protein